jgi:asparagine synthase (glutamine-hydrolysing)
MCGIAGFFDLKNQLGEDQLRSYNKALQRRGPDDNDFYFTKIELGSLGFSHVRLSILDLSSLGKQPMQYQNLVIVLNGEIYNFISIKKELLQLGYIFNSGSDTEVVLKSFHAWGTSCVEKFRGMFAFAIYDAKAQKIFLCRDRVGVKPLYYYMDNEKLLFGSEMKVFFNTKGFNAKINQNSLRTFINYGYVTHPHTILSNVFKAEVGSWTILDLTFFTLSTHKYWDYAKLYEKEKFSGTYEEAVLKTEEVVKEACELRMVSDVPVGVFLSGGFDSTLVATMLQKDRTDKLKTFTIGFSDGIDESIDAERIAKHLGTDHTSYDCQQKDAIDLIPLLPELYDDPIADISTIPTMLVSKLARQEVMVALSADGGDELFAGYDGFKSVPEVFQQLKKVPLKKGIGTLMRFLAPIFSRNYSHVQKKLYGMGQVLSASTSERLYQYHIQQAGLPYEILDRLFLEDGEILYPIHQSISMENKLDELFIFGVEDVLRDLLLVKVDRATMGFSLEGREPLLDHVLMEFAASLPYHYKHDGLVSKRPIREIVYKYLPIEIMNRPKVGFDLPLYKWLNGDLKYLLNEFISIENLKVQKIFDPSYVEVLVSQFKNNHLRYTSIIWRLLVFQMWYKKWL